MKEPMTHALKCHPKYYEEVISGAKPFELRRADRPFAVGDLLVLQEWDPQSERYTGRQCARAITYVGRDLPGLEKWHVALGLRQLDADLRVSDAGDRGLRRFWPTVAGHRVMG